ncbi:glutathione S-transferase [Rubidibacter lacunae KORDI 51-2]|uniref:Glutathione S-transferase n=1 Tax=Rubidibacter lacunae KORDI 51-2 TaxID=582515 RepID=U5DE31_9CHRO|nr:glutathione S-transferase family protein [Rubidibacter lacunae]ERN42763.1 glutathione S-transferase [Rubidibacter lacunae KORDI 51-2]
MLLLQFSTSHYCRKARLALGFKQLDYTVENLTPGLHALKLRPLTGLTTLPVLVPQTERAPEAIADSTRILRYLEATFSDPPLMPRAPELRRQADWLEDWFDESIGTATRFAYYDFRAGAGKQLDPSPFSQILIAVVRRQYGITPTTVALAHDRLRLAFDAIADWKTQPYLVGNALSHADLTAAALLSPLVRIPDYRDKYPWAFARIAEIHHRCREPLPPGLED